MGLESPQLRLLIANEERNRLESVAQLAAALGHEVIARATDVAEVRRVVAEERPDLALVGLGASTEHALELISAIVREGSCPVIALLPAENPAYVRAAAEHGVFAYIVDTTSADLQSTIEIALQRFAQYRGLQGAFERRALIEQAKGILMERHAIDAERAFELMRRHARPNELRLVDAASALIDSHLLLPAAIGAQENGAVQKSPASTTPYAAR